jgi:BlaI family penicillinase repressor
MKLTESEWQIMNSLWERHPATARGIAERLPERIKWAYTTIRTLLARLAQKGAVREYKEGNTSLYEPLLTRDNARRSALKTLANQAFDGAFGPLLHFLVNDQSLSPKQRKELTQALEKQHTQCGGRGNDSDTK